VGPHTMNVLKAEEWYHTGQRVAVSARDEQTHRLFGRVEGEGPVTTFLHGFPTSSWDWAKVAAALPSGRKRIYIDLLGYGDSDKPVQHTYSLLEELDLLEAFWKHFGVEETLLVTHDVSVSIGQELLARINEGTWRGPHITGVVFLNGGLFFSVQRPLAIQRLLRNPVTGPIVTRLVTRRTFERSMRRIYGPHSAPDLDVLTQQWAIIERRGGSRLSHKLSRYHDERKRLEQRWTNALSETRVPLTFVWGMRDPISGSPMLGKARQVVVKAKFVRLEDVGHYPQIEAAEKIAKEIEAIEGTPNSR
jgi:pimeloyl-ACP methyl ester carboxylesterase